MVSQQTPEVQALLAFNSNPYGDILQPADIRKHMDWIWNADPMLKYIYDLAAYRRTSPYGLFAAVKANLATRIPPFVVLVDAYGQPWANSKEATSLNIGYILIGSTGAAKSIIGKVADTIVPPKTTPVVGATGQGIVKAYNRTYTPKKDADGNPIENPQQMVEWRQRSLMWKCFEFGDVVKEYTRQGSRTDGMLRAMLSGEGTGQQNNTSDLNASLLDNTYRYVSLWATQPMLLAFLMALYHTGDPQRFVYAPVDRHTDQVIPPPATAPTFTRKQHRVELHPQTATTINGIQVATGAADPHWGMPQHEEYNNPYYAPPTHVHWSPSMAADIDAWRADIDALYAGTTDYDSLTEDDELRMVMRDSLSHIVLTTIKDAALTTFLLGHADPRDTKDDVYISDLAWTIALAAARVSLGQLALCFSAARYGARKNMNAAGKAQGTRNHIAQQTQVECLDAAKSKSHTDVLNGLARLFVKRGGYATPNEIRRAVGRKDLSSAAVDVLLGEMLAPTDLGGEDLIPAVEMMMVPVGDDGRVRTQYRLTEAAVSSPAVTGYLDRWQPDWRDTWDTNSVEVS